MPAKDLSQSLGVLFDERRDFYLPDSMTKELWKNVAPFTTAMSSLGYDGTSDPDFKMFEHRAGFVEQKVVIDAAGGSTWSDTNGAPGATSTVTLDWDKAEGFGGSIGEFLVGQLFEIWSAASGGTYGGVVRVQSISGNDITIVSQGNPSDANNYAAAPANDYVLELLGSAIGEGETSPEAFADELEVVYNSAQIMRTPVEITGTLYEAALRGYSNELARLRTQKSFEHKMQKENIFLRGIRVGGTGMGAGDNFGTIQTNANGKKVRQTMGAITALRKYGNSSGDKQNIFSVTKASDGYSTLVDYSEKISQYVPTSGRFLGFSSRPWISWFSAQFLKNTSSNDGITIYNNEKSQFGYKVMRIVTPHCEIDLAPTVALRRNYSNHMLVINPDAAGLMKYRPMKYFTNIKTENNYDGIKDEYFSDEGVRLQMIETHSLWTLD